MTVLVDEARWEWRGSLWAHLISDASYDELHELARRIGKRRLGFQGDHYDVDSVDRERAIAAGAVAVDSRDLVRRLAAAGLRRSDAKPRWQQIGVSPSGTPPAEAIARLRTVDSDGAHRLAEALTQIEPLATVGDTVVWSDEVRLAVLIDIGAGVEPPAPGRWSALVDEVVIGGTRVHGDRSVELFADR